MNTTWNERFWAICENSEFVDNSINTICKENEMDCIGQIFFVFSTNYIPASLHPRQELLQMSLYILFIDPVKPIAPYHHCSSVYIVFIISANIITRKRLITPQKRRYFWRRCVVYCLMYNIGFIFHAYVLLELDKTRAAEYSISPE